MLVNIIFRLTEIKSIFFLYNITNNFCKSFFLYNLKFYKICSLLNIIFLIYYIINYQKLILFKWLEMAYI